MALGRPLAWGTGLTGPGGVPRRGKVGPEPHARDVQLGLVHHEASPRKAAIFSLGIIHPRHFRGRSFK